MLPTGHYLIGGALAVAASFFVLARLSPDPLKHLLDRRWNLTRWSLPGRTIVSMLSFACFVTLVFAGWWGTRDPLANPLPLAFWTLLWTGLVIVQGVLGNLWAWLNPWYGPHRIVTALLGSYRKSPLLSWPRWLGAWLAFAGLALFAWFELAYPAPNDPSRLANVIATYWILSFIGMLLFGYEQWMRQGEFLSLFMSMIAQLSPFQIRQSWLLLRVPGARIVNATPLPFSKAAFLLLALSTVTFDGFRHTFRWLALIGVNPLEFPGRSAVMMETTLGLVVSFFLLAGLFVGSVALGVRLAGSTIHTKTAVSTLVWTIMPIAFAYHVAHYLPSLLIDGQYALVAISDPFALGRNLFGTAHFHVHAGLTAGAESAWLIWNVQAATIVIGHVIAVIAAHVAAWRLYGNTQQSAAFHAPLALLMIVYTIAGLWLLSTPTGI